MRHDPIASGKRRPVNVSLDTGVVDMARKLGLNLSRITEAALVEETRRLTEARWKAENKTAIEAWKRWYSEEGDPLAHLRAL